jgi:hypothetical protein
LSASSTRVVLALLADALDAPLQGVTLGSAALPLPLEDDGSGLARHLGGAVGAMVGNHVNGEGPGLVVLGLQALHHAGHHPLFVVGANQDGDSSPGAALGRSLER